MVVNNQSGWMEKGLFLQWIKHFHASVNSTKVKHVLLILDGRASHTKNFEAINFARDNGILMLSQPSHTTHRKQPLDRTFYKPLMTNYNAAADRWMRNHAGRAITVYQVCSLFGEAYKKTATMTTATNGISCSGIWSCNRDIFTDPDYAAAERYVEDKYNSPEDAPAPQLSPVIHEQSPAPCVAELAPATPESSQQSTANPEPYPVVAEQASYANTSVVIDKRSILPGAAAPATLESTQRSTAIPGPYPVVAEQSLDTSTSSVDG